MKTKNCHALFLIMLGAVFISCNNISESEYSNENDDVKSIDEKYIGTYKTENNDVLIVTKNLVSFNGTAYNFNDFRSPEELADEYPCKLVYTRDRSDLGSGCVWSIYDWINNDPILVEEYYDPEDCSTYQYGDVIYSEEEWKEKKLNLDFNEDSFPFLEIKVKLDGISTERRHKKTDNKRSLIKVDDNKYIFFGYTSICLEIYENESIDLYKTKTAYQFRGQINNNQFYEYTTKGELVWDLYKGDDLIRISTGNLNLGGKRWLEKTFDEPYKTVERLSCSTVWFERQIENTDTDDNNSNDENNNNDENSTITGTYSFTNATPPQMNGSITLSNGNWSYSGDKSSPAASNGTYTASGNKITVKWNASGYEVSETFTITESGSNSTWESENSGVSTFFSMLFGVTGLEMTFTKS